MDSWPRFGIRGPHFSHASGDKIWPTFCLSPWTIRGPCLHGIYTIIVHEVLAWDAVDSWSAFYDSWSAVQPQLLPLGIALLVLRTTNLQSRLVIRSMV
ncbi:hypothetical protein HAX54_017324, partial [Datura stramonium]|nr:hypothetical protein [Datura stramonium]